MRPLLWHGIPAEAGLREQVPERVGAWRLSLLARRQAPGRMGATETALPATGLADRDLLALARAAHAPSRRELDAVSRVACLRFRLDYPAQALLLEAGDPAVYRTELRFE
jgi:hypothetical protein